MAADHFCLRWNNYQSNMVSELDILRSEEHLVDVTLSCEGQKFRAHKVILSACSAYFRNVFKENPCEHPVVILKDVNHEDVEALLSFVYQGVVYVSEKKLSSFLQTAELLQIKGLTGAASTLKDENLSDKSSTAVPNKPVVPARKVLPSVSPPSTPPVKRRKGAPVRICKPHEEADDSDNNSQRDEDDQEQTANYVKQENTEETESKQISEGQPVEEETSMEAEGELDSNESVPSAYPPGEAPEMSEDGEVKREEATLLERSLVAASMSRPFESPGSFPPFPVTGIVPGNAPLPEQVTPTGRGEWKCMQPQRCYLCHKVFSNSGNLRQHISNMHMPQQYVPCQICHRVFKNKEYLRKHHVQTHNAPLRRPRPGSADRIFRYQC
ncbi:protein tramtrack, beta isoform-like [Homalodisca vitripennis]|uniref:protein tramtrack, beta isoform-like isoform X2 n=1 Tax=Homalodisca vitripennis TaxID=197043 RepID=UPI001EEAD29A|nr:protein tramtrack, beta isoform-like isoform X2 [Homalodisca vitripennis]XP_046686851.1 protein tramtrack, beta isoform-like [Homalodisca vitripennis]